MLRSELASADLTALGPHLHWLSGLTVDTENRVCAGGRPAGGEGQLWPHAGPGMAGGGVSAGLTSCPAQRCGQRVPQAPLKGLAAPVPGGRMLGHPQWGVQRTRCQHRAAPSEWWSSSVPAGGRGQKSGHGQGCSGHRWHRQEELQPLRPRGTEAR